MSNKYLKLILFSTVLLQASPKVFNSLGNELEVFQADCKKFQKVSFLPTQIKKKCNAFNSKANNAFKIGYKLDPYIDSEKISEKQLNEYLGLLRQLDEVKQNILHLISLEKKKVRKEDSAEYYSQLIANNKIRLYPVDYAFMKKHKDIFGKNERYLAHLKYLEKTRQTALKQNNNKTIVTQTSNSYNKGYEAYQQGYEASKKGDIKEAFRFLGEACDAGYAKGCANLGGMYALGQYVQRDYSKAREFATKACNGGYAESCFNLGGLYYFGQGVKQNYSKAKEFFRKACDGGYERGCTSYTKLNK